ncbi:MAG: Glutamine transport ATP-binding protein GlnQ [Gemmatimonadaceae bacterium]|nr:Glutamine transport ATP-binding protein GlnQ [Gemmatimonadaceae bacterium]
MEAAVSGGVEVSGLVVRRGPVEVLSGVDMVIRPGEACALMGVSGAGKSTVLRAVVALEPFDRGSIDVDGFMLRPGRLASESALKALRQRVGMVFQAHSLFEHLTVLENLTLAPIHTVGRSPERAVATARRLLATLGVAHREKAYPGQLSGGEAQRVAIARALALDPMTLLLDEPTSALDPARRGALGDSLRSLAREGRGLLAATHDVDFARAFADRVVVLAGGQIVEEGPAAKVLDDPAHPATRELLRYASDAG